MYIIKFKDMEKWNLSTKKCNISDEEQYQILSKSAEVLLHKCDKTFRITFSGTWCICDNICNWSLVV